MIDNEYEPNNNKRLQDNRFADEKRRKVFYYDACNVKEIINGLGYPRKYLGIGRQTAGKCHGNKEKSIEIMIQLKNKIDCCGCNE